jgi:hypothetical protein
MHWVRRAHLYLGLFLFPWAVLYGVTAFLFNHPAVLSDRPTTHFGKQELLGTPLESPPAPAAVAAEVVRALQQRARPGTTYRLIEPSGARYTRDFAFATVSTPGGAVAVLVEVSGGGGTIRAQARPADETPAEPAPFAVAGEGAALGHLPPDGARPAQRTSGLRLDGALHERVKSAIPMVLQRTGIEGGEVTVTSVPDLAFSMHDGDATWKVTYNALTGSVSGKKAGAEVEGMSARRFLTELHLAHGYPSSVGTRWLWAVVVDVMAAVLVFWGVSGLFMWWQIKATRPWGVLTLAASATAAAALAAGMFRALAG